MALPIILGVAIVVVFALAAIGRGIVLLAASRGAGSAGEEDRVRLAAEIARDRALTDLRDIEMEHALRKLNDADYTELKRVAEGDAYAALRRLRALAEERAKSTGLGVWIAMLLAGALCTPGDLVAQALPAGHPPIASAPTTPAVKAGVQLQVHAVHIAPNGVMNPLAGVRAVVTVESRRPGPREVFDPSAEAVLILDGHGRGVLAGESIPRGGRARAAIVYQGTRFEALADAEGQMRIDAFDRGESLAELSARLHVGLSVDESRVWVQTDMVVHNPTGLVIDLTRTQEALQLPLVGPVIGGVAITAGWMPPQARRHMKIRSTPDRGLSDLVDGTWTYKGLILPGATTRFQIRYPLDIDRDEMKLGLRYDQMPIEDFLVTMESGSRIQPNVVLSRPSVGQGSDEPGGGTRVTWLANPLPAGETVEMRLMRLPASPNIVRRLVLGGLLLGAFAWGVGLLRARALARVRHV